MLKQNVNLIYTPPPPPPIKYSFRQFVLCLSVVIVVIIIIVSVQAFRVSNAKNTFAEKNNVTRNLSSQIVTLSRKNQHLRETSTASQLERKIILKQKFTAYLQENGTEERSKIAVEFMGLANTIVEGVWLTYIEFHSFGQEVYLIGQTNKPSQVYQFLGNLNDDPVYTGIKFDLKKIEFPDQKTPYKVFSIYSGEQ
jgi:Tfp pilus assembly protein PilN